MNKGPAPARIGRLVTWWIYAFAAWVLLTWTLTTEQIVVGAAVAGCAAIAFAPLGRATGLSRLLDPRRWSRRLALAGTSVARSAAANVRLAARVWKPSRPLRTGMLVVPTTARTPSDLTTVGLVTSLVVDNQLVDLDPHAQRLQYHAIWVASTDPERNRATINEPVERYLETGG